MFPNSTELTTVQYVLNKIHAWRAPVVTTDHTGTRGVAQKLGGSGGWSAAAAAVAPKAAPSRHSWKLQRTEQAKGGATGHSRPSGKEQEEHLPPGTGTQSCTGLWDG